MLPFASALAVCAAFAAMVFFYLTYQRLKLRGKRDMGLQIAAKCAATAMAALVALMGCLRNGTPSRWVLLAGLIACAVADGVLCVRFVPGGALFGLGHVLYILAFCLRRGPDLRSAAVFLALAAAVAAGYVRLRAGAGRLAPLVCGYALLLSAMVAVAAIQGPLLFAGAVLFAASDGLLALLFIHKGNRPLDYVSLGLYYCGQFLLGLAALL